jgi:hypothetical protein
MQEYHLIRDDTEEGHFLVMTKPLNSNADSYDGSIIEVDPGFRSDDEYLQKRVDEFIERQNRETIETHDKEWSSLRFLWEDIEKRERIQRKLFPED